MKSTVEQLSPTRVKINVEVPFDELKPNFDRAYKKIAQQVRIPGFRPGKAPARVLEQRLGRGVVLDEVVNEAVPAKYAEAVNSGEVRPLGRPDIEVTKIEDGDHLAFTAEVDVRPVIEIPAFDFSVSVDDAEVTEAEVDEQLSGLRTRFGTLISVDRPIQEGDFVQLDLTAAIDGEEIEDLATAGLSYEVGSGRLFEGIDAALVGARAGERPTFSTTLVIGPHAGKQAEMTVEIGEVKQRELPAADDEFAQLASEFDTLDELKTDLRDRLGQVKAIQQGGQAREKVLEALLAATEVPLPESLVQREVENRMHDTVQVFEGDEQRFEQWLAEQGQTAEQFETDLRGSARDVVKSRLLLDAIADAEELSVGENELMERILLQAQRYGISPSEYVRRAETAGGELGELYAELRRRKALDVVVRQSTLTDASGNPVHLEEFSGQTQDGEEPAATAGSAQGSAAVTAAPPEAAQEPTVTDAPAGPQAAERGD